MSEENFAVPDEYLVSVFGDRPDMVQPPPHYTAGSVECIDALESPELLMETNKVQRSNRAKRTTKRRSPTCLRGHPGCGHVPEVYGDGGKEMREILFKAKRLDNGECVDGFYCCIGPAGQEKHYIIPEYASAFYGVEVDPSTVCEWTGLTDKNGKKIFEGDILDESGEHFTVVYDSNWAKFRLQYHHAIQFPEWNRGVLMEVIGSIHNGEGGQ